MLCSSLNVHKCHTEVETKGNIPTLLLAPKGFNALHTFTEP